jgi:hypothetical protein
LQRQHYPNLPTRKGRFGPFEGGPAGKGEPAGLTTYDFVGTSDHQIHRIWNDRPESDALGTSRHAPPMPRNGCCHWAALRGAGDGLSAQDSGSIANAPQANETRW